MIKDVTDCTECGRKGVGLVRPYHNRSERPRAPKITTHNTHKRDKGEPPAPRCTVGSGLEVMPEQIYKVNK